MQGAAVKSQRNTVVRLVDRMTVGDTHRYKQAESGRRNPKKVSRRLRNKRKSNGP